MKFTPVNPFLHQQCCSVLLFDEDKSTFAAAEVLISIERIQSYISDLNTIILDCSESLETGLTSTGTGIKWNHARNFEA